RVNTNVDASELLATLGIVASADIAKVAIPRSNIVCITGDDMVTSATAMLNILYNANPESVGGALPGEDLFYAG
ncbi:MAG: ABC transporter substrate-binding protein, partial [Clostridiaceae bacterium]